MNAISTPLKRKVNKTSFVVPFIQFDWGDYYADTDYLSFEEHGIYWNLLKRYYTTGPFTGDIKNLQRITRCPKNLLNDMQAILDEFFYISEDDECWHHKRCDEEIMRAKGISEVQSTKARKGAAQRKRNSTGQFTSSLPTQAGDLPAIKEEDEEVTSKIKEIEERHKDVINNELRLKLIKEDLEEYEKDKKFQELTRWAEMVRNNNKEH